MIYNANCYFHLLKCPHKQRKHPKLPYKQTPANSCYKWGVPRHSNNCKQCQSKQKYMPFVLRRPTLLISGVFPNLEINREYFLLIKVINFIFHHII